MNTKFKKVINQQILLLCYSLKSKGSHGSSMGQISIHVESIAILITHQDKEDSCDASSVDYDAGEDCWADLLGEDSDEIGGIFKFSMLPSNTSRTLCIEGLSDGLV